MKLDPRIKLLLIAMLTSLAVFAKDIVYLGAVALTALLLDIMLRANILDALKRIRHFLSLIVFIAVVQSLTVKSGKSIVSIGNFTFISSAGLLNGAEFALRMGIIILASIIATTEKGRGMTDALIKLKLPYEIAFMVSVTIRFIPMFREEFASRLTALKLRGINIKKLNICKKVKVYTYLLSPTVAGSIIKSRELANAMEARAFRAYPQRTMLRDLRLKFIDYAVIISVIAYVALFAAVSIKIGGII
ncbi:MAG: energy-coupling factor transporter transmembrane protein EcfT [Clostridia bacterium]|nr:energy-coupling factor transporter transmembrane protein EcfT [Clostridia bacterium]